MPLSNSQYDRIMRDYTARALFHANELAEHERLAYAAVPRLREIKDEVASLCAAQARKKILGDTSGELDLSQKLSFLAAEKANLLETYEFPADYLDLKYDCPICKDTGVDGHRRCKCFTVRATQLLYTDSGLKNVLEAENFDTFDLSRFPEDDVRSMGDKKISVRDNMKNILARCKAYAENFDHSKKSLLFTGPVGCGKTFMTHCIAKALMDKDFSVIYQSADRFCDTLANAQFHNDDSYDDDAELMQMYEDVDLLIIDDLGTEYANSYTAAKLFNYINHRISYGQATIISSNLSIAELTKAYTERMTSRFFGNYDIFLFFGPDQRRQKYSKK